MSGIPKLLVVVLLLLPSGVQGQLPRRVGGFVARMESKHLGDTPADARWKDGVAAGVYLDSDTPVPILSVRVEVGYYGRGNETPGPTPDTRSRVTSHYVGMQVHGRLRASLGPLGAYFFGGPFSEYLVKTGCSEGYCEVLGQGEPMVWGVAGGAGVEGDLPGGGRVVLELRWMEGLSAAYTRDRFEVKNRSRGVWVQFGVPF